MSFKVTSFFFLKLYLTVAVSLASCSSNFSKLKVDKIVLSISFWVKQVVCFSDHVT